MISLENVHKEFAGQPAVRDVTLEVARGEICCLIGPSGCGKTTSLKMMNRMIEPSGGRIRVDGHDIRGMKPHLLRRKIGYVIQSIGLFPHMTVLENICIVPRLLKWSMDRARRRGQELLELFDLQPDVFSDKYPHELSGGQAQRIGVARALAADPEILLMDEPFGALDPLTRSNLQVQFGSIQAELGKTVILVTHDVDEAVLLGSRIALMDDGRLVQADPPERMLSSPRNDFVRRFFGTDRALKRLSRLLVRDLMRHLTELPDGGQPDQRHGEPGRRYAVEEHSEIVWQTDSSGLLQGYWGGCVLEPGQPSPSSYVPLDEPSAYGIALSADLRTALTRLLEERLPCLPVVQGDGCLNGEIRLKDILRA
jgi:osmoprotectant transport system ATP-binding protein